MVLVVFIYVSIFLGLLGILNVIFQPRRAFRTTGHSKRFWVLFLIVATLSFYGGFFAFFYYRLRILPRVLASGGRPDAAGRTYSAPVRQAQTGFPYQTTRRKCTASCDHGKVQCNCSNGYDYENGVLAGRHFRCNGTGKVDCQNCGGSGYSN
jgi:hypothetical protein